MTLTIILARVQKATPRHRSITWADTTPGISTGRRGPAIVGASVVGIP